MIHLARRDGTVFLIEDALENSDIVILDGSSQHSAEFGQSDSEILRRAIWIDPPSHVQSPRSLKRPLHWSSLLAMMDQIAGNRDRPSPASAGISALKLGLDRLCAIAEGVLRKHIGIAAGFVVEDARSELIAGDGPDDPVAIERFLDILKRQMPYGADAAKIISEISAAVSANRTEQ